MRANYDVKLLIEGLESRIPFSVDAGNVQTMEWQGRQVGCFTDYWVVKAADAPVSLNMPSVWIGRPLGEGFFSVFAPMADKQSVLGWASKSGLEVEPDFAIAPTALPNDPSLGRLWGMRNLGQSRGVSGADIRVEGAWNTTTGSRGVVIAVVDTGVDYTHPDLAANIWTNPSEIAGDGLDNDGDGYVDDVHGYDFANNDGDPMDDNGHGTHVAGTIGAVGNNGIGVVGVNWQVSIMPVKFLDSTGTGSTSNAIAAVNYVTRMRRDFGFNIVASNNSWGGGGYSTLLRDAIDAGGRAGILFVAAAGNQGADIDFVPQYPASYPGYSVISVAASDQNNSLAGFSNYGMASVDLAAPGSGIYSTVPGNAYAAYSGTSMAVPHVTGAVALLASAYPTANRSQIRSAIMAGVTRLPGLAGVVTSGGVLNVSSSLDRLGSLVRDGVVPSEGPAPVNPPVLVARPVPDAGDTMSTAFLVGATSRLAGTVGDGRFVSRDVDIYRVSLRAGQTFVVDIDARSLPTPSRLDSYVRLFGSSGAEIIRNDDSQGSFDSYLIFTARTSGTYFVGISSYRNSSYSPINGRGATTGSSMGAYEVTFSFGPVSGANAMRTLGVRDEAQMQGRIPNAAFAMFYNHESEKSGSWPRKSRK